MRRCCIECPMRHPGSRDAYIQASPGKASTSVLRLAEAAIPGKHVNQNQQINQAGQVSMKPSKVDWTLVFCSANFKYKVIHNLPFALVGYCMLLAKLEARLKFVYPVSLDLSM